MTNEETTANLEEEAIEIVYPRHLYGSGKLLELDESFLGTDNYLGLAYFWNHEYRHYLRDASPLQRVQVHNCFCDFGLELAGESDLHLQLIDECLGNYTIAE